MIVDVEPFIVTGYPSGQKQDGGQYKIMVEGHFVGLMGYQDGAKVMLHQRFNPMQLREIESTVRRRVIPQRVDGIVQVPEPRPEKQEKLPATNREDFG